jgi:hypothetical protein
VGLEWWSSEERGGGAVRSLSLFPLHSFPPSPPLAVRPCGRDGEEDSKGSV